MKFLVQGFQKLELEKTEKSTNGRDRKHYHAAFASGNSSTGINDAITLFLYLLCLLE